LGGRPVICRLINYHKFAFHPYRARLAVYKEALLSYKIHHHTSQHISRSPRSSYSGSKHIMRSSKRQFSRFLPQ
jgi:hypothetical protein